MRTVCGWETRRPWKVLVGITMLAAASQAQTSLPDPLNGTRYMKQVEDLAYATVYKSSIGAYNVDVLTFDTSNSQISPTPASRQTIASTVNLPGRNELPASPPVGVASGRMFNTPNDEFVAIAPNDYWALNYYNPRSGVLKTVSIGDSSAVPFGPQASPSSWIVMGDFRGDGLKEALAVFAAPTNSLTNFSVGMAVLGAVPNGNNPPVTDTVIAGPGYYYTAPAAQPGKFISGNQNTVIAGDFNGDGKDEVAVLMNDQQTVRFYAVDPDTYAIKPMATASITLATPAYRGVLVAGHFVRPTRLDLVVVGIDAQSDNDLVFGYINTQSQSEGTFNPQVETPAALSTQPYNPEPLNTFFAQAAPLIPQTGTFGPEQLVLASQDRSGAQNFWIGDFLVSKYAFTQLSYTNVGTACLTGMQVANFDHQTSKGAYNPNLQVAFLANLQGCSGNEPVALVESIQVPSTLSTKFSANNWLSEKSAIGLPPTGNQSSLGGAINTFLSAADIQGRSQLLGAPEIVTLPSETQPEVVLGMPPMEADYVIPPDPSDCATGTGNGVTEPCAATLTFAPSNSSSAIPPFANQFVLSQTSTQQAKSTATASWGLSVKTSIGTKVSFNDLEENASVNIKDTAQALYKNTVAKTNITGSTFSTSATTQTLTSDLIFFNQRDLNIYYYPVLGMNDSNGKPVYVEFSIPTNLSHFPASPATQYDWYQPVQEPGNVFSYPWSFRQLSEGFSNSLNPQTRRTSLGCQTIGADETFFQTSWANSTSSTQSIGSSSFFSNDFSMSASGGAGVSGIDGATINESVDIDTSTSFQSLNVETNTVDKGEGVKESSPGFPNLNGWDYYIAQYIWGENFPKDTTNWAQPAVSGVDNATSGPLFVGFIADPAPERPGGPCANSSAPPAWGATYTLPDIGLNHPKRWHWSGTEALFNYPNGTTSPLPAAQSTSVNPFLAPFYWMKGFFITAPNASISGPNLTEATEGDTVQLTARIYNFSLKDTDDTSLQQPAAKIHVDFYVQQVNSSTDPANSMLVPGTLVEIGEQVLTQAIPGFKSVRYTGQPNWILAHVPFETSGRAGQNLVFWVLTWMEDKTGALVQEMPGHGLWQVPFQNLTNMLDPAQLFLQSYSNNVGMYGVHTPFSVVPLPPSSLPGSSQPQKPGILERVAVVAPETALLNEDVYIHARLEAAGGPVSNVRVSYYDGNPATGTLLDSQTVHRIPADSFYVHGTSFQPMSCGPHEISVKATTGSSEVESRPVRLAVTVDPVALTSEMQERVRLLKLSSEDKDPLLLNLRLAHGLFQSGQIKRGVAALQAFADTADLVANTGGKHYARNLAVLSGEVKTIEGCLKLERPVLQAMTQ